MPIVTLHFDTIDAVNRHVIDAELNPGQKLTNNWRVKYIGWVGEAASVLRVHFITFYDTFHHQSFQKDTYNSATTNDALPFHEFVCTGQEISGGSTINLFGSISTSLSLGKINQKSRVFSVHVEALNSFNVRQSARNIVISLEYD